MAELIESVLEVFPYINIKEQAPASYVQFYTKKNTDNIVLAYIKGKEQPSSNGFVRDNKTQKEELELTGSPLKLDLSLHVTLDDTMLVDEPQIWLKEEAIHKPLKLEKAREVGNIYNELLQDNEEGLTVPMWILCDPQSEQRSLLLTIQSWKDHFIRGLVTYENSICLQDIDVRMLVKSFAAEAMIGEDSVEIAIDSKYLIAGMSYDSSRSLEELLNAPQLGSTNILCEWTDKTLQVPIMSCKVILEQEVIVGHLNSSCNSIWKSVCALNSINQLLVDMTAAGISAVQLDKSPIRNSHINLKPQNSGKRLSKLLKEVEVYTYTVKPQKGGFICVTDKCNSLKQCLDTMNTGHSSNDFTYRLWDILKDSESAEELIILLIQALKVISSGKIKPFIDANNKTYLSKLVLKLSRGHSQTAKVLKNLRSNPQQALSMIGQVGIEKTIWEFTNLMSLVEHSFFIAGIWSTEVTSDESIEQINQTINDMTMCGDCSLNPFDNRSSAETSIRIDCESFYEENELELTVDDDFASLMKHGSTDKKTNEVPLIADEIDISGWKNLLMKFAQLHVCLEHLNRTQHCLKIDFATLKPVATRLREHFVADKSPIKTVGQLMYDPIQKIALPIENVVVKDQLLKPAYWYRVCLNSKEKTLESTLHQEVSVTQAFSQQPIFPPSVWQHLEQSTNEPSDATLMTDVKYYQTKFTLMSNQFATERSGIAEMPKEFPYNARTRQRESTVHIIG